MAAVRISNIGAEGCYFDGMSLRFRFLVFACARIFISRNWNQHNSELRAYGVGVGENLHDLRGRGAGGNVVIRRLAIQEKIAHTSATR